MEDTFKIAIFKGNQIRRHYDEKTETWYFSVVDIISALTASANPTDYLKKLRKRDSELGNYIGTNCPQIEMATETGKNRKTLAKKFKRLTYEKNYIRVVFNQSAFFIDWLRREERPASR